MSLFKGLGFGPEKPAVIIDIGKAFTKCGFAGDNAPRSIIYSEVKDSKTGQIKKVYSDGLTQEEQYSVLSDFFYLLYFRYLVVSPKERRVVIIESVLTPSSFRDTVGKVLFQHFEVPSVLFAPSHLLAVLTLGVQSALVVDVGFKETVVLPIYESTPLLKAWESLPVAGKAIHNYLEASLLETCTISSLDGDKPLSSVMDSIDEKILEDIKVKCCFVTKLERAKKIQEVNQGKLTESEAPEPPPSVDYPLDGGKILHISGKIRENTCEVLFEQDREEKSVATLILDSILKCPIDARKTLAENLVVMGGTSMQPGFMARLVSELKELVTGDRYQPHLHNWKFSFHQPPTQSNYTAWLGGAIMGALEILASRSVTRDAYNKEAVIPDWCSLYESEERDEKLATPLKR